MECPRFSKKTKNIAASLKSLNVKFKGKDSHSSWWSSEIPKCLMFVRKLSFGYDFQPVCFANIFLNAPLAQSILIVQQILLLRSICTYPLVLFRIFSEQIYWRIVWVSAFIFSSIQPDLRFSLVLMFLFYNTI